MFTWHKIHCNVCAESVIGLYHGKPITVHNSKNNLSTAVSLTNTLCILSPLFLRSLAIFELVILIPSSCFLVRCFLDLHGRPATDQTSTLRVARAGILELTRNRTL